MREEFHTGSLELKIEGRIRFGRKLLGICLPAGQKDRIQSPTERENKARNYKLTSDKGYVRFWEQILLLQDMLCSEAESEWEQLLSHLAHPQTLVPLLHTRHTLNPPTPWTKPNPQSPTAWELARGAAKRVESSTRESRATRSSLLLHMCVQTPHIWGLPEGTRKGFERDCDSVKGELTVCTHRGEHSVSSSKPFHHPGSLRSGSKCTSLPQEPDLFQNTSSLLHIMATSAQWLLMGKEMTEK